MAVCTSLEVAAMTLSAEMMMLTPSKPPSSAPRTSLPGSADGRRSPIVRSVAVMSGESARRSSDPDRQRI